MNRVQHDILLLIPSMCKKSDFFLIFLLSVNFKGTIGSCGFVPLYIWPFVPAGVVKVDQATGELIRNPTTGLGIECDFGEPGEFVGVIRKGDPLRQFDGYIVHYKLLTFTQREISLSDFRFGSGSSRNVLA
jgi:hypothetical protein